MQPEPEGVTIYFNPFAFTTEQNNEFIRRGYEVMPLRVPSDRDEYTREQ
jgi:type IV secretory pathway VirB4 component